MGIPVGTVDYTSARQTLPLSTFTEYNDRRQLEAAGISSETNCEQWFIGYSAKHFKL